MFHKYGQVLVRAIPCGEFWFQLKRWMAQIEFVRKKLLMTIVGKVVDSEAAFLSLDNRIGSVMSFLLAASRIIVGYPQQDVSDDGTFVYQQKIYHLIDEDIALLKLNNFWDITRCCTHVDLSVLLKIGSVLKDIKEIKVKDEEKDQFQIVPVPFEIKNFLELLARSYKLFTEYSRVLRPEHADVLRMIVKHTSEFSVKGEKLWQDNFEATVNTVCELMSDFKNKIPVISVSTEVSEYVTHRISIVKEFFAANKSAVREYGPYATFMSPTQVCAPFLKCGKCVGEIFFIDYLKHLKGCVVDAYLRFSIEDSAKMLKLFMLREDVIKEESGLLDLPLVAFGSGRSSEFLRYLVIYYYLDVLYWFLIYFYLYLS